MTMSRRSEAKPVWSRRCFVSPCRPCREDRRTIERQSRPLWRSVSMTFQIPRRLTLLGICAIAPFVDPAGCHVERAEGRESWTAAKVIVRPVVSVRATGNAMRVTVPRVALHQDEMGGPQVFVYSPAERRVRSRRVALGTKRSGDVDISSGLEAGEMIVVGSRERLVDGAVVQVINEPIVVTAAVTVGGPMTENR